MRDVLLRDELSFLMITFNASGNQERIVYGEEREKHVIATFVALLVPYRGTYDVRQHRVQLQHF